MADSKQPEAGDGEFVACLSAKEIKKLAKPEFAANPGQRTQRWETETGAADEHA